MEADQPLELILFNVDPVCAKRSQTKSDDNCGWVTTVHNTTKSIAMTSHFP